MDAVLADGIRGTGIHADAGACVVSNFIVSDDIVRTVSIYPVITIAPIDGGAVCANGISRYLIVVTIDDGDPAPAAG